MGLFDFLKNKPTQPESSKTEQVADFSIGDIFYTKTDEKYNLFKLLVDDKEFECYHILTYSPLDNLPSVDSIDNLQVFVYHSPFDKKAFADATLLTNKQITANDLIGYHEYLHQTQEPNYYVSIANSYYCNTGEKGIFIIGATNRPERIDPAILGAGRLDKKFYVPPPDFEARKAMFELYLKKKPLDFGIDYERLAQLTQNYVSGDIKLLVDEAARKALKAKERISMEILENIIKEVKPTISLNVLGQYEQLRKTIEGESAIVESKRNPIGFRRTND